LKAVRRPDTLLFREAFKKGDFADRTALVLSSWFGSGLFPIASGTFGTLAAIPFVVAINYLGKLPSGVFLVMLTAAAIWSAHVSRNSLGIDDPSEVVIDEAAGFCLSVFLLPFTFLSFALGFLFFRAFDILKPFPIGLIDKRVKGGLGIVLDDLVAGLFANICVRIILALIIHP
jgi:phosphatidylglycerophosphatase A